MRRRNGHEAGCRVPGALVLPLLLALGAPAACDMGHDRPNVIFIVTDDQAFSTLPHMQHVGRELAQAGITFENFILNDPICCPSRVTILLGQYRHNHRLEVGVGGGCAFRFYKDQEPQRAIGPLIQAAGYRTGIVGKYLNSYKEYVNRLATKDGIPKLPGWDDYHILAGPRRYYNFFLDENAVAAFQPRSFAIPTKWMPENCGTACSPPSNPNSDRPSN